MTTRSLSDFTKKKTKTDTVEPAIQVNDTPETIVKPKKVGLTVRLDVKDWERLHYLAIQERTKIQSLLVEGLNVVFQKRGLPRLSD